MKISGWFVSILFIVPLLHGSGVDQFFSKHPELRARYRYLIPTSIDLEIDRAHKKQAELFTLLNDIQSKLPKGPEVKGVIAKHAESLRNEHEDVIGAWEALRKEVSPADELCVYCIVDGDKSESGFLILRAGAIVKVMKETDGVSLIDLQAAPVAPDRR
ncbi:MAG: hypothetical protein KBG39_06980 [Opitutaceae bacterium]|nr:hypothetical protein [Opitutaceae bacterium]